VLGGTVHLDGGAGVVLPAGAATAIVSQGCRPVGSPWVITDARGQLVRELGGRPALERLTQVVEGLSGAERASAAGGLHVGLVADEQQAQFDQGDFLIRGVLGADRSSGAIAVGDAVDVGQILQFQIRDASSASKDLRRLLGPVQGRSALLFTCNGRGTHLFPKPNHDAAQIYEHVCSAVSGMFCAGELGPIAGRNAMHAFTATVLVFH
jgi:small ligand-binding sensory domain FIST